LNEVTDHTIAELEKLPQPDASRIIADFIQAMSCIALGNAQDGLSLIEKNLESKLMEQDDFRFWKYRHFAYKGNALTWLARPREALIALDSAHAMDPNGDRETAILTDKANCLLALDRYQEAYDAASRVLGRGDEEMATLAMNYMAECRMWQKRWQEALSLYAALQKRLPCRLVQTERVEACIKSAEARFKRDRPRKWPF
jgi:tetratricopeptide (TPR) repeat protein